MIGRTLLIPAAASLVLAACGSGTVSIGERDDTDDAGEDCPQLVASTDSLTFTEAFFGVGNRRTLEVDNRCVGSQRLILSEIELVEGDADAWVLPPAPLEVAPGSRLTLDVVFLPSTYGSEQATLVMQTNDPAMPELRIALTGTAAEDQDADGFRAVEVGGDDCDDDDAGVNPGRDERDDGKDQDCDGLIDEDFLRPGDVVITEIFALPSSSPRARQWVEVRNASPRAVDLAGWTLSTAESTLRVSGSALLDAGQTGVLARNEDAELVVLPRAPTAVLTGADELVTLVGSWELTLAAGENVVYILEGATFPRVQEGASLQLDRSITDPFEATRGDRWCVSPVEMPSGERGTPFTDNAWCPQIDHDGDGVPLSGDCDDADPDRFPGAVEIFDGIDNDCDGTVDRFEVPGGETAELTGLAFDRFWALGTGDFDNDGQVDVAMVASANRRAYLMDTSRLSGTRSLSSVLDDEWFASTSEGVPIAVAPTAADVDGDGVDDIVMASNDLGFSGTPQGLVVATDGDLSPEITVGFAGESRLWGGRGGAATVDFNGDGRAEVLVGSEAAGGFSGVVHLVDLDSVTGDVSTSGVGMLAVTGSSSSGLGVSVAGADLDDDGYEDLILRESGRGGGAVDAFLIQGALRTPSGGAASSVADRTLSDVGRVDFNLPTRRPVTADFDDDGVLDLAIPSADGVRVWLDGDDLLTNGSRSPDLEIDQPSGGQLCGVDAVDADGDGTSGLLVSWTDRAWTGTWAISYFDGDTLASGVTRLRPASDDDGRISSGSPVADLLGCGLRAADVAGGSGQEIFAVAPQRRTSSGAFDPALWYFQSP